MYPNHEARIGRIMALGFLAATSLTAVALKTFGSDIEKWAESMRGIKARAEANNPISAIKRSIRADDQSNVTDATTLGALIANPHNRELRASSLVALQEFITNATTDSQVLAELQQDIARDRLEFAIQTATRLRGLLAQDTQPAISNSLLPNLFASLDEQYRRYVEKTQGR